jgi:hypothetical protein
MTQLTSEAVNNLMTKCLFTADEAPDFTSARIGYTIGLSTPPADSIVVEGVVNTFAFHPGRIAENTPDIAALLALLPAPFKADGPDSGGGWSFLNACVTKDGVQWTDLHRTVEALVVLGIAAGKVAWMLPRKIWSALPGGMPYFVVKD